MLTQSRLLSALPEVSETPIRTGEVFARLGMTKPTMSDRASISRTLSALAEKGLIERSNPLPDHPPVRSEGYRWRKALNPPQLDPAATLRVTQRENAMLRTEIELLKARAAGTAVSPADVERLKAENAGLRQAAGEAEARLRQAAEENARLKASGAQAHEAPAGRSSESQEDFDARVKAAVERVVAGHEKLRGRKGLISGEEAKLIRICLHPDRAASDKDRERLDRAAQIWAGFESIISITALERERQRVQEEYYRRRAEQSARESAKRKEAAAKRRAAKEAAAKAAQAT